MTQNAKQILQHLSVYVIEGSPCLLSGPYGTGKSFYIQALHSIHSIDMPIVWLYIDDTADSKSLLGGWQSGAHPGEFEWSDGVLTKAVKSGRWIVFENVDRISSEIQIKLKELVEGNELFIPERNMRIKSNSNFRLFGTVSTNSPLTNSASKTTTHEVTHHQKPKLLAEWRNVELIPLSRSDVIQISTERFPHLVNVAPQLFDAFQSVQNSDILQQMGREYRQFGVKDFFRLCNRIRSSSVVKSPMLESVRMDLVHEFFIVRIHSNIQHD